MKRDELIQKWLDHNLNTEEQKAFEQLEDYDELKRLNTTLKGFKAPEYNAETGYKELVPKLKPNATNYIKYAMRIAAVLLIGLVVWQAKPLIFSGDKLIDTAIAQHTTLELPDHSFVKVNANSSISYNANNWDTKRDVKLNGEAFFKVAKGKTFNVITSDGVVSVLGTEFNVKQRNSYFEVVCYEGSVSVTHKGKTTILVPGNSFIKMDETLIIEKENKTKQPSWLNRESNFKSVPLKYVIAELENQYDIKIINNGIDASRVFTGSFTHKNLDLALKSVTLPLSLKYKVSNNSITLMRE